MSKIIKIIFLILIITGCSNLIYYPSNRVFFDPKRLNLNPENIYFQNSQNKKIHAWWFESKVKPAKGTIVFFHGNAENLTTHFIQLSWMPEAGYNYFIFDYPGYGESEGDAVTSQVAQTSIDAIKWVHQNKDQNPLIIYGQSIGGITALRAALETKKEIPLRLIVLDSSFYSYKKIATYKMSKNWFTWILQPIAYLIISDEYAPKNLSGIPPTPILLIHGQQDQTVESFWSDELFEKLQEPKEIWRIQNADHMQFFWIEKQKYRQQFLEYLEKHR